MMLKRCVATLAGMGAIIAVSAPAHAAVDRAVSAGYKLGTPLIDGDTVVRSDSAKGSRLVATVRNAKIVGVKHINRDGVVKSLSSVPPTKDMAGYCAAGQLPICFSDQAIGQSICFCEPTGPKKPRALKGAPQTLVNNTPSGGLSPPEAPTPPPPPPPSTPPKK